MDGLIHPPTEGKEAQHLPCSAGPLAAGEMNGGAVRRLRAPAGGGAPRRDARGDGPASAEADSWKRIGEVAAEVVHGLGAPVEKQSHASEAEQDHRPILGRRASLEGKACRDPVLNVQNIRAAHLSPPSHPPNPDKTKPAINKDDQRIDEARQGIGLPRRARVLHRIFFGRNWPSRS